MEYTGINYTDLEVSILSMGTATIGVDNTEQQARDLLDCYLEQGGNFIDTARVYSNWVPGEKNRSERIIGDWMQDRKNREELVLATKGAHPRHSSKREPRMSYEEVAEDLDGSLKSLQTDYIDLYYLHRDDPDTPVSEIIEMLEDFAAQGKIRYYACSNWTTERIRAAQKYAKKNGYHGFVANQMLWNIGIYNMGELDDETLVKYDQEMHQLHRETGLAAVPYTSQAQGFFTKMKSDKEEDQKKVKNSIYNTEKNRQLFNKLEKIAEKHQMNITEIVLSYLLSQDINVIPIIGCRNKQQLEESMAGIGKILPFEVMNELEEFVGSGIEHI